MLPDLLTPYEKCALQNLRYLANTGPVPIATPLPLNPSFLAWAKSAFALVFSRIFV